MFNGYYGQFMYNERFFHDGQTGQIIVPVLRPGNCHSNKWYVSILERVIQKVLACYPRIRIIIRADSGFSCPAFYGLAGEYNLDFIIGLPGKTVPLPQNGREKQSEKHTNWAIQRFLKVVHQYKIRKELKILCIVLSKPW